MTPLVIFDLDRTLAKVNVSFAFGVYLYKTKALGLWPMLSLVAAYGLHKTGFLPVKGLHKLAFHFIFAKQKACTIQNQVRAFLAEKKASLFRGALVAKLLEAKQTGAHVWLQSSSPECLVNPIAQVFDIQVVLASHYQVGPDGTYTKVANVVDGKKKRDFLEEFLSKKLVSRERVTAYSDSALDLPLLEAVGVAIAVHPETRLRKIAKERKWQIWEK